ncbi:cadherin-5 [Plakobranchus ocellatus]|uniref:Cadherin-5 n=1 Tax=Plakobranchus ocellatus TaxID=259542 RepID=A0AAV4ASZ5_9GAST|nr:cadherin-5 [Plakobranchus ocellatus]
MKTKAYDELVEFVKEIDPNADRNTVVKKINNLRSAFRKEVKKADVKGGVGKEPKLFYYDHLLFLLDQERSPKVERNDVFDQADESMDSNTENGFCDPFEDVCKNNVSDCESEINLGIDAAQDKLFSPSKPIQRHAHQRPPRDLTEIRKRPASEAYSNTIPESDQYDVFGKYVAHKLRRMTDQQSSHAEKFISQILYEGQTGNLSSMSNFSTS